MRYLRLILSLALLFSIVSCAPKEASEPPRSTSCVLDSGDYALRVYRGGNGFQFISPGSIRGAVVRFAADGTCTLDTTRSLGRGGDGEGNEYPGVEIALTDGRGFRDWLLLAYPEDADIAGNTDESGVLSFETDGAYYRISPDGKCSVTRDGLTRTATRKDD